METFRVRNVADGQPRKVLLPMSLGVSSVSLLHILHDHIEGQIRKTGRAGYSLHVVHVALDEGEGPDLQPFEARYPRHMFSTILLDGNDTVVQNSRLADSDLSGLISSISTPSSRKDIQVVALRKRLVDEAHRLECDAILWGDTTTSLAEKILAETAKGRGFTLPWLTNDGESPLGLPFYFPMRDVLRKELLPFADFVGLGGEYVQGNGSLETTAPVSMKNATIDDLMKDYFQSVEENYPSVVANVVRTSGKLHAGAGSEGLTSCSLCGMPFDASLEDGTAGQAAQAEGTSNTLDLCYGCNQTLLPAG